MTIGTDWATAVTMPTVGGGIAPPGPAAGGGSPLQAATSSAAAAATLATRIGRLEIGMGCLSGAQETRSQAGHCRTAGVASS